MHTAVLYHPAYQTYYFGPEHPFSPVRIEMALDLVAALGYAFDPVAPAMASREEVLAVHSEGLVRHVEAASRGHVLPEASRHGLEPPDVPVFEGMDEAARILVGGTLEAARRVASGAVQRALQFGGGLHHARHDQAAGFCVYNDLAVAIRYLRDQGLRVAYLDIDVHHGDGVQWLFYDDPGALTISLHETGQYLYPGTGAVEELGQGAGTGYALNVPLEPFTQDASYLDTFERVVPHALAWFRPEVLVVQCGADAHADDPLAHLLLTTHAYERLFRRILELAEQHTHGRLVLTLGGGYNLDATVRVWTLLYGIMTEQTLPEALPEAWLDAWQHRLNHALTPTLHDEYRVMNMPRQTIIEQQNRERSKRLLERAAPYWH